MSKITIKEVTLDNIKQFIQGNSRMFADKLSNKFKIPFLKAKPFIQEQVYYRSTKCPDCLAKGQCMFCTCSVPGKWFADKACKGKRFPDIMLKEEQWEEYKKINGIKIDLNDKS